MNVATWADRQLERCGDFEALVAHDVSWTARRAHEESCRFAAALPTLGVPVGGRVLIWLPNGVDLVTTFTGAIRSGAVAALTSVSAPVSEVERLVTRLAPSLVVTTAALADAARAFASRVIVAGGVPVSSSAPPALYLGEVLSQHQPLADAVDRRAADPAQIVFSSGVTGQPKAVVWTHGLIEARYASYGNGPGGGHRGHRQTLRRELCVLPLSSAYGTQYLYFRLLQKTTLVLMERFDQAHFFETVERHRIAAAWLVPTMCEALLSHSDNHRNDISSLATVIVGGAPVSPSLVERFWQRFMVKVTTAYGLTELGPVAATEPGCAEGVVGQLRPGIELRIVDSDGRELPPGEPGEIQLNAGEMCAEYHDEEHTHTDGQPGDGWFRTGDLGYRTSAGALRIVGRTGDRIIQGGVNVYPQEIVDVVRDLPDIEDCAVIGVPDAYLGEAVVVAAVRQPGSALTSTDVLAWCRGRIDARRLPVWVTFLRELPRNEIGKIRVAALREMVRAAGGNASDTSFVEALRRLPVHGRRRAVREMLNGLVARFIDGITPGQASVEPSDTFGQLGFDSLRAVGFSRALADVVGRPIPATVTFNHPTVDAVCDYLLDQLFANKHTPAVIASRGRIEDCSIAIVGMACRLPGGVQSPESFWTLLREGQDATTEITRWDIDALYRTRPLPAKPFARRAALLNGIDAFDADFFGFSPSEARVMDARHRLTLETTWEAFENAGYNPRAVAPGPVGTFLGMSGPASRRDATIGDVPAMAVGRICHFFDLRGPATVVDTTCSSSLFAIHLAVQSLRRGECNLALAGGVHVISSPGSFVTLGEMGLLASDGRSKSFAADADGYGRGEGCAMLVLKRLSDANTDDDRVVAVIRGSAAGHDGRSSSLTAPNGLAQQDVIRAALADAGVEAADVDYLEAHGAGTPLGDPIEIEAATTVFGERDRPVIIGSVKTNFGHLEAAAGAAAVVKVALSLEHGVIPPHLHCGRLNPLLRPFVGRFAIPATLQRWPEVVGRGHIAGVSSMGLSGTNVHVVLESAPESLSDGGADVDDHPLRAGLLCLSARTDTALQRQRQQYADYLTHVRPSDFAACCYTASVGRAHFAHRLALVATGPAAARALLTDETTRTGGRRLHGIVRQRPKVAFLFTGQGAQHFGMGHALFRSEPVFRAEIERCAERLDALLPRSLLALLYEDPAKEGTEGPNLDDMQCAQPALCALQWSLCALWRSWGIEPDFVLGHSLGECAAACAAGLLTPEDGLLLAATRGRLLQTLSPAGAMVAIKTDVERVRQTVGEGTGDVAVAAHNGPTSTVISGRSEAVAAVVAVLEAQGIESRSLAIPRASHSPLVDPLLGELERVTAGLAYSPPRTTFVSTLSGHVAQFEELSQPAYWSRQMREPVQFATAIGTLITAGCEVFIEIGPHPTLISLGQDCTTGLAGTRTWLTTLHRERDAHEQIMESLAELYVRGIEPDWGAVHGGRARRVSLPTYPFARSHVESYSAGQLTAGPHERSSDRVLDLVRVRLAEAVGVPSDSIGIEDNILSMGIDSLRVIDFLTAIRSSLGVSLAPADLMAQPTAASFARLVLSRIEEETTISRPFRRAAATPLSNGPLVTLNAQGGAIPLFCVHPSGGQATAYLRFQQLLGDDQPLFAIQSRALTAPHTEHLTIEAMAADYATLVQSVQSTGPYRLIGWSMGGVVAHAMASELERRGERVEMVGMIDAISTRAQADLSTQIDADVVFALMSVLHDQRPSSSASHVVADALHDESGRELFLRDLYAWCERRGLLSAAALPRHTFAVMIRLYRHHFQLIRDHQPSIVEAPLVHWRSDAGTSMHDWARRTRGGLRERLIGGTHFSIVQPPSIDRIAGELAAFVAAGA